MSEKVQKSNAEWLGQLTPEQFQITRQGGTERPFSNAYHNCKDPGTYLCVCCGQALFGADSKYDSGTGWPSFWQPITEDAVTTETDRTLWMVRTEVLCSRCDAHLGHVFEDGPQPSGQRYCMNATALRLEPPDSPDSEDDSI